MVQISTLWYGENIVSTPTAQLKIRRSRHLINKLYVVRPLHLAQVSNNF